MDKTLSKKETEKLLERIKKRMNLAMASEAQNREAAKDDDAFYDGDQWPLSVKNARQLDGRPCLTVNKLPQYVKQIVNPIRKNRPQIKALPVDDGADVETAKIITGLFRHIQTNSNADIAFDTMLEQAVIGGWGYLRVLTDYASETSFDQEIFIRRIMSRFSVLLDPSAQDPCGSDAKWGFVFEDLPRSEFEVQFPEADVKDYLIDGTAPGWIREDTVRIAEYYEIENKPKTLLLLRDGSRQYKDTFQGLPEEVISEKEVPGACVYWYKTNGAEILEGPTKVPGQYIPIVRMIGDEVMSNGEVHWKGIVRNSKDPQRMVNYWWTNYTEMVALAPKAPYIGYTGQFADPNKWASANQVPYAYLEVDPDVKDSSGNSLPLPQRQAFAGIPTGIEHGLALANDDMKETTGIYDASLGAQSNETSGKAINARKVEGEVATFNYPDNHARALRQTGRIMLGFIPVVYDAERQVRILGEDGTPDQIKVNAAPEQDEVTGGEGPVYDLTVGQYDVVVDVGPGYATKRQEAAESMTEFIRVFPQAAGVIGDLVALNQDWPGADKIAARLKSMLPPQVLAEENQHSKVPPEIQQAMAAMQQQMQEMQQQLAAAQMEIENEDKKLMLEKYKTDTQAATQITIAKMKDPAEDISLIAQEVLELRSLLEQQSQPAPAPVPMQPMGMEAETPQTVGQP